MLFKINTADSRPFSLWEGGVWVQEYWQTGLHLLPVNLTGNIAYIHQVGGAVGICDKATSIDFHYCATCNTASIWSNPVYICVCVCVCVCVCGVCVCVCAWGDTWIVLYPTAASPWTHWQCSPARCQPHLEQQWRLLSVHLWKKQSHLGYVVGWQW